MATKAFGVKELKIDGTGTPTIESPSGGNLNVTAATATFSGNLSVNGNLTVSGSGGGGTSTFLGLTDTPANYTSQAGKILKVNSGANALVFSNVEAITISTAESSDDNNVYNIPFLTSTGGGGAQKGLQVDNGGLTFNPGTNLFAVQSVQLGYSNNIAGYLYVYDGAGNKFGQINGIPFGIGNNTSSTSNLIIGQTTTGTSIGQYNVGLGYHALQSGGAASYNVAIGYQSLLGNGGAWNVALGDNALSGTGNYNIGIGRQTGHQINGASYNIFMGYQCARSATSIGHSIVFGYNALDSITDGKLTGTSGTGNTWGHIAIGYNSQKEFKGVIQNGAPNIAMGICSLEHNVQSGANIAIGNDALRYLGRGQTSTTYTGGYGNVAVGSFACKGFTGTWDQNSTFRSDYNTAIGWGALEQLSSALSDKNTGVGVEAGRNITTGTNNTCIGNQAGMSGSPSGQIQTGSNNVVLGNNSVANLYCADTSISSSDARDKTDVEDFKYGLSWITELRPVTYRWDRRTWYGTEDNPKGTPDGSKKRDRIHIGFLAQEAIEVEKKFGYAGKKDDMLIANQDEDEADPSYGMKYERLVPVLVNAIKELSAKNDALEARLDALES